MVSSNPNTVINKNRNNQSPLKFPIDKTIENQHMIISFKQYNRASPLSSKGTLQSIGRPITLPLPTTGLEDNTNLNYNQQQLGAAIGGALSTFNTSAKDFSEKASKLGMASQALHTALGVSGEFLSNIASLPGSAGKSAVDMLYGNINNPNLTLAFDGVKLRSHVFSWRLIAKNFEESQAIYNIILELKTRALPQQIEGNLALKYPDIAIIDFKPSGLISMTKYGMFLEDISIKYDSEGYPSFHKSGVPVVVDLSLKFTDRYILTSSDYTGQYLKSEAADAIRKEIKYVGEEGTSINMVDYGASV